MDANASSARVKNEDNTKTSDGENEDKELRDRNINATSRSNSKYSADETRNQALQRELENVRNVNKVIEDATASLEKAKNNMEVMNDKSLRFSTFIVIDFHIRHNLTMNRLYRAQ